MSDMKIERVQDQGGMYDRDKFAWAAIQDASLVAACGPVGGGRAPMSQRFTRHFQTLYMPEPPEATMRHIFEKAASGFFALHFPADVGPTMLKAMVASSVEAYAACSLKLLPTPYKPHYTFNLRDLSKIFQVGSMESALAVHAI